MSALFKKKTKILILYLYIYTKEIFSTSLIYFQILYKKRKRNIKLKCETRLLFYNTNKLKILKRSFSLLWRLESMRLRHWRRHLEGNVNTFFYTRIIKQNILNWNKCTNDFISMKNSDLSSTRRYNRCEFFFFFFFKFSSSFSLFIFFTHNPALSHCIVREWIGIKQVCVLLKWHFTERVFE